MLSLTYWYTALGLWCTAGIIWLTLYTHFFITHVHPVVVLWVSALLLGLGYGAVTRLSRFGTVAVTLIYIAIITLTGVSLAYLFSGGATIFVIVGIMFSLNALFIFYLNISSGLFRPLIFMAVSGIIAAIVVNSLVSQCADGIGMDIDYSTRKIDTSWLCPHIIPQRVFIPASLRFIWRADALPWHY